MKRIAMAMGVLMLSGCLPRAPVGAPTAATLDESSPDPVLAEPYATRSVTRIPKLISWGSRIPKVPPGYAIEKYADNFDSPQTLYVLPNGDLLVCESRTPATPQRLATLSRTQVTGFRQLKEIGGSPNTITLLRDRDRDGRVDERHRFVGSLNLPYGMLLAGSSFYVANTDGVLRFQYRDNATSLSGEGERIIDIPADGANTHWLRSLAIDQDQSKLFVGIGGAETDKDASEIDSYRAAVLESDLDGKSQRIRASGLRSVTGMMTHPLTGALWAVVDEREGLGDELVPDFLAQVRENAFYGWPAMYFGEHRDPRYKGPSTTQPTTRPDYALGAHVTVASMLFPRTQLERAFMPFGRDDGVLIAMRGSWNRSKLAGYHIIFVPFQDGAVRGPPIEFVGGFVTPRGRVRGRPSGLAFLSDGSLVFSDVASGIIWRVTKEPAISAPVQ